jgi:hypothetical protein
MPTVELVPDLIVHNAQIATLNPIAPEASAVAVLREFIVAVGADHEVLGLASPRTRLVDARGRRVVPGLMDNHTHYLLAALDHPDVDAKVNIAWAESIAEIVQAIGARVARARPGEWIASSAMYRGALQEGRFPTRDDLDAVSPDNPVYVFQSGKNIIVNSQALRLAGIDRDTPDPPEPEGHIVRGADGEPTGHLIAGAADLARARWWSQLGLPPKMWDFLYFPQDTLVTALHAHGQMYLSCGVVAVRDMGVSVDEVTAYLAARDAGRLPVRTDLVLGLPLRYISAEDAERRLAEYIGPGAGIGDDWVSIGGLKLVVQNDGWWAHSPEKLRRFVLAANRRGWRLAIHVSSGTAPDAVDLVLSILEEAHREIGITQRRFTYEHGFGLTDPVHIRRVHELGMIVAASPLLAYYGAARSLRMHDVLNNLRITKKPIEDPWKHAVKDWGLPFRDWLDAGIPATGGTDNPAVPYDPAHPLLGIYQMVSGDTLAGILLPGQQVTAEEALRMWTIDNARAVFQGHRRGSIEVGKLADLVMFSGDPLSCPTREIPDITVLTTIVGGAIVHEG